MPCGACHVARGSVDWSHSQNMKHTGFFPGRGAKHSFRHSFKHFKATTQQLMSILPSYAAQNSGTLHICLSHGPHQTVLLFVSHRVTGRPNTSCFLPALTVMYIEGMPHCCLHWPLCTTNRTIPVVCVFVARRRPYLFDPAVLVAKPIVNIGLPKHANGSYLGMIK